MEKEEELIIEQQGSVGTLTIHRPERGNALSPNLLVDLHLALQQWAEQEDVRAVVVTGAGNKAFSGGYDIRAIPTDATPETNELIKKHNPLELALSSLRDFPFPTLAMMNGYAFGGGLNLAICCDIRIGEEDIKAGMPPAKLGVVYPPRGLRQFVEVLGMARTREVFFSGRTYRGAEVKEMGLVDHLVSRSELKSFTYGLAKEISENAPLSLKGIKRILNMLGESMVLSEANLKEAEGLVAGGFESLDLKEGQAAFLEKRKPRFIGK